MPQLTTEDAFTLALIAQRPHDSKDLMELLSDNARPIGASLTGHSTAEQDALHPQLNETVEMLRHWAEYAPQRKAQARQARVRSRQSGI